MSNFLEKTKNQILTLIGVCFLVFLTMRFLVPLLLPFLVAFFFVCASYTKLCFLNRVTRIGKGFWAGVILFLIVMLTGGLIWYIGCEIISNMGSVIANVKQIEGMLSVWIHNCCDKMANQWGIGSAQMEGYLLEKVTIFIENMQMQVTPKVMGESVAYAKTVASFAAGIAVTFIASVLLAKDYDKIKNWTKQQKGFAEIADIIQKIGGWFAVFVKAQIVILFLISIVCSLGFLVLRVSNPFGLGLLTGFLELLPFIGTGIILIPSALFSLLQGEFLKAIGYILIYILCILIREFLEPKLIGKKMGVLPIGILAAIYVGVKIYGLQGIILGPVSVLLIIEIMKKIKMVAIIPKEE